MGSKRISPRYNLGQNGLLQSRTKYEIRLENNFEHTWKNYVTFIGWKFAISKDSFDNGVHFWHLKYESSSFREVPSIAFGLCVLPLQQGTTASGLYDQNFKFDIQKKLKRNQFIMQTQFGHMLLKMGNVIMLEESSSWLISIQAIQVVIIFFSRH